MAAGDIINPKRPRYQSNERFDYVDAEAMSEYPRGLLDTVTKVQLIAPPKAAAAAVGMVLTGCNLTPNPTGATDGKVRLTTDLAIALDADGRFLVKPAGTTLDLSVPSGTNQIYLYYIEAATDNALRRFISNTAPFSESANAMYTSWQGTVGVYSRVGGSGSIIPSDTINGVTTALVYIGNAVNTSGTVTIDLSGTNNRLPTLRSAPTYPTGPTANGSMATVHDLVLAGLYAQARAKYKSAQSHIVPGGSATPGAVNNFGAWTDPRRGLDDVDRSSPSFVTIGDGSTSFGNFDRTEFATDDLLLQAAVNAVVAQGGGVVFFKPGVSLSNFAANVTVVTNNGEHVTFLGNHSDGVSGTQLVLGAYNIVNTSTASNGSMTFVGMSVSASGTGIKPGYYFSARDSQFNCLLSTSSFFLATVGLAGCTFKKCFFISNTSNTDSGSLNVALVDFSAYVSKRVVFEDCDVHVSGAYRSCISLNVDSKIRFTKCDFTADTVLNSEISSDPTAQPFFIKLSSNSNTVNPTARSITNCTFQATGSDEGLSGYANYAGVNLANATGGWRITGSTFAQLKAGIVFNNYFVHTGFYLGTTSNHVLDNQFLGAGIDGTGGVSNVSYGIYSVAGISASKFNRNTFIGASFFINVGFGNPGITDVQLAENQFLPNGNANASALSWISHAAMRNIRVSGNDFSGSFVDSSGYTSPPYFQGGAIYNFKFTGNDIYGFYTQSVADCVLGCRINSQGTLESVVIGDNTCEQIQNLEPYTGGAQNIGPRLFELNGVSMSNVTVHHNTGSQVAVCDSTTASNSSGSNAGVTVLYLDGANRTGGTNATWLSNIVVDGNTFGSDGYQNFLNLMQIGSGAASAPRFAVLGKISIENNTIYSHVNQGSGYPYFQDITQGLLYANLDTTYATNQYGSIEVKNNYVHTHNDTIGQEIVYINNAGGTGGIVLAALKFDGNTYVSDGIANVRGFATYVDFYAWSFSNNSATHAPSPSTQAITAQIVFSYTNTNRQIPVIPASGSAMPNNIGIGRY